MTKIRKSDATACGTKKHTEILSEKQAVDFNVSEKYINSVLAL